MTVLICTFAVWRRTSWPVSRVLCTRAEARADGHPSRVAVADDLQRSTRKLGRAALERFLSDLAPGGVCQAARVTPGAGGPLPHRFTLTDHDPKAATGGLFSVALSRGSPRVGVTDHPALRSPDFPRRHLREDADAAVRPTRPPLHRVRRKGPCRDQVPTTCSEAHSATVASTTPAGTVRSASRV
jgi:hypothetical protein